MTAGVWALWLVLAASPPRLAVMEVRPAGGASESLAEAVTEAVVSEVRRQAKGTLVIGASEIRSLLAVEREKQQLGCDQVSCLAEVGGALGAARIVNGTINRFGGTYLLALRMVDVRRAQVLAEGTERISSQNEDGLLDAVTRAVHALFPGTPMPARLGVDAVPHLANGSDLWEVEEARKPRRSHALGITLVSAGVVAAGFAVYGFAGPVAAYRSDYGNAQTALAAGSSSPKSSAQLAGELSTAQTWQTASSVLIGVALAAALGGALTW